MKKKIYAVLLLTAVCAGSGVFAQSSAPKENLEKYYTLERIRSKSGWLVSDNAAGLMLNQASLSIAEVNYDFEQGGLRNVTDGAEVNAFGVRSESYRRWNRLSFYGKLSYDYAASKDRSWAGNANIGDSPMLIGDSIPGNTRDETYAIEAGVAYRMGRWVVGAMGKYEDRSLAKRRDSRNKTTSMYLSVQPGVMFTSKVVDAGLNFTYERTLYAQLTESDYYKDYMQREERSFDDDKKLLEDFFKELQSCEALDDVLEEMSILWTDDLPYIVIMVLRTLSNLRVSHTELKVPAKFKSSEDPEFVKTLFEKSLVNYSAFQDYIEKFTANWDVERIVFMDNLIIGTAMAELTSFPSVPVKVTLDEWIEISKYYSTPGSSTFINGVLDKIVESLTAEGRIKKAGRGLI